MFLLSWPMEKDCPFSGKFKLSFLTVFVIARTVLQCKKVGGGSRSRRSSVSHAKFMFLFQALDFRLRSIATPRPFPTGKKTTAKNIVFTFSY